MKLGILLDTFGDHRFLRKVVMGIIMRRSVITALVMGDLCRRAMGIGEEEQNPQS